MDKTKKNHSQSPNRQRNSTSVSNITGGITDEEFASEFLAQPAAPNTNQTRYQFNFLGADLEKVSSAKNIRDELKK